MNSEEKALKLIEDSMNKKCNGLECKVVKNNINLRLENIKKNKIIDLMAEQLAGLTIWNNEKEEPLILTDKEDVIKYFKEIVERKKSEE